MNGTADALRRGAVAVARRLREAGHLAYFAGGCVRDELMNRQPKDYDIATQATPEQVAALFPATVLVGKAFGVARVSVGEAVYEVATFRKDHAYRDGRRPEGVTFSDPRTDAERRDFTVNALFYDPSEDRILDFVDGRRDMAARLIRAVGDPAARFAEDHLRLLRAVRFAHTLGFAIEERTAEAIRLHAARIADISAERIQQEFTRILLEARQAGDALRSLQDLGLLPAILPEVSATVGQEQPPDFHPEGDVFTHTVLMLNDMETRDAVLAYAVLLHDVGKPQTVSRPESGRIRFDGHARCGAKMAESALRRLRLPSSTIEAVSHCVANHMRFMDIRRMKPSTLRRMLGAPDFRTELELHRLDCLASHGKLDNYVYARDALDRFRAEPVMPPPWVTGADLLRMGVPEGPDVGRWKRKAYDLQLDGAMADREAMLAWVAHELKACRGPG